jgi:hypothetical protein
MLNTEYRYRRSELIKYCTVVYCAASSHSWVSVSRPLPSVSAFGHPPASQLGTGALPLSNWVTLFQNRPGFGIGIFVNRYLTDRISDSPASKNITKVECTYVSQVGFTLHVQVVHARLYCWCYTCYMMSKTHMKLPECRSAGKKVSAASAFLPLVNCLSPASAFRHQGKSGTSGQGLCRQSPATTAAQNE